MESERTRTKQSKGFTALIWGMSILACVLLVAFVVIGTGYFRIQEVRAAISQPIFTEAPAEAPTAAPTAEPEATPTAEPIPESTPLPTAEPGATEDLPDLELNIQGQGEMQMFASIPDVVEAASASVVGIIQYQPNARTGRLEEYGSGSGFIVSENGYVLTNAHVVSGAAAVDVLFSDGEKKAAQVVGADVTMDVAVLKVELLLYHR